MRSIFVVPMLLLFIGNFVCLYWYLLYVTCFCIYLCQINIFEFEFKDDALDITVCVNNNV